MEVILLEKIGKLGDIGDTVKVKAGFGRNFLVPHGKAVYATKDNLGFRGASCRSRKTGSRETRIGK